MVLDMSTSKARVLHVVYMVWWADSGQSVVCQVVRWNTVQEQVGSVERNWKEIKRISQM